MPSSPVLLQNHGRWTCCALSGILIYLVLIPGVGILSPAVVHATKNKKTHWKQEAHTTQPLAINPEWGEHLTHAQSAKPYHPVSGSHGQLFCHSVGLFRSWREVNSTRQWGEGVLLSKAALWKLQERRTQWSAEGLAVVMVRSSCTVPMLRFLVSPRDLSVDPWT